MPAPVYKRLSMDDFSFMSEVELDRLTQFFKLLADPTRVRLILLLSKGEWCVRELSDKLGTTQSAVSHQLSMLKSNHLVCKRRQGKQIYYTLADREIGATIETVRENLDQRKQGGRI